MGILKEIKAYRMEPNADIDVVAKQLRTVATQNPDSSVELMVGKHAVVIDPTVPVGITVDDIIDANSLRREDIKDSRSGRAR